MTDPLQQSSDDRSPLFSQPAVGGTRAAAGAVAALRTGSRRARILQIIRTRPSTLYEIADQMGMADRVNAISGRLSELQRDGYIKRSGQTRPSPASGCDCDVYVPVEAHLAEGSREPAAAGELAELLGYAEQLYINGELHDRQPPLPNESYPGVAYAVNTDNGANRRDRRVELIESPCCGKPLLIERIPATRTAPAFTKFRCKNPACKKVYRQFPVKATGQPEVLALVMEEFT